MKYITATIFSFFLFVGLHAQEVPQANFLAHWSMDGLPSSNAHDNTYNEIWGLYVNDREFAVIGSTMGTHIIDVTDVGNISQVAFVEGAHTGPAIIHRDYHDHNGYLYAVCDEGNSTLQIIDISNLPSSVEIVYDSNDLVTRSHNIFIDADNDRLYSCAHRGTSTGYSALRVFDISDPMNPVDEGGFDQFEGFEVGHVHDAFIKDNIAYLNCGFDGFALVDMTDIEDVTLLGVLESEDYPDSGYNHSGWLSEEEDIYYMADENHGLALKAVNVEDINDMHTTSLFGVGEGSPNAIAHNPIVDGDLLFVSYYFDGLQVYDISNREEPKRIMHYPTSTRENNFNYQGAWGVYPFLPSGNILVSDMQEGLFIIDRLLISSTNEVAEEVFGIYPNPTVDELQVSLETEGSYHYVVRDLAGRIVQEGEILNKVHTVHTSTLPLGSYIIELSDGHQVYAQLFSVAK